MFGGLEKLKTARGPSKTLPYDWDTDSWMSSAKLPVAGVVVFEYGQNRRHSGLGKVSA